MCCNDRIGGDWVVWEHRRKWGTVHGNLPRIHGGDMLVLCETQGIPLMRDMRTGNRPLWGLGRRDSTSRRQSKPGVPRYGIILDIGDQVGETSR